MRAAVLALTLGASGCGFSPSAPGAIDDSGISSRLDGPGDVRSIDGCTSFSVQVDTCTTSPMGDVTVTGNATFNTDTGVLTNGDGGTVTATILPIVTTTNQVELDVIFARAFTLAANAHLRAIGSRPAAIVASGALALLDGAVLDVSAGGAGAHPACDPPAAGADNTGGAAGGGGGGYGGAGGTGGNGNADNPPQSTGGLPGPAIAAPSGPRGGCPGAHGGTGADLGGAGGPGGGAIYLASAVSITIGNGGVTAGGGGGKGGVRTTGFGDAGGGGGGAAGMIRLEAPTVKSSGTLAANGGGGGEASGNSSSGNDGTAGALNTSRSSGGGGHSSSGSDGGDGGNGAHPDGDPAKAPQAGGGGGGGGGVGHIVVHSGNATLGSKVSPAAVTEP